MLDQFYEDLLPEGQHVVATLSGKKIQHYVVDSTQELIPFLEQFQNKNTYHSLGAYSGLVEGELEVVKNLGGCTGCRAFTFDLDVGEERGKYESLEQAFEALALAIEEGHCPEPTWTVYSGGGLQFALVLGGKAYAKGLPEELWSRCFQTIRAHLMKHLKIDPTVGSRPYRLLRSPCTPNWKYGEPVMPEILNEERGPYITGSWIKTLPAPKKSTNTANPEADGLQRPERPVGKHRIYRACKALRQMSKTGGQGVLEPEWFAAANISAHTFEYRAMFHELSSLHSDYDPADTDAKFNHVAANAMSGPMGCEFFGDPSDESSPCHGCWAAKAGLGNPVSAARKFGDTGKPKVDNKKAKVDNKKVEEADEEEEEEEEYSLDEVAEDIEDSGRGVTEDGIPTTYGIADGQLPDDFSTDGEWISGPKGLVCMHFIVKQFQFNERTSRGKLLVSRDGKTWREIEASKLATPAALSAELFNIGIRVDHDNHTLDYVRQAAITHDQNQEQDYLGWSPDCKAALLPSGSIGDVSVKESAGLKPLLEDWRGQSGTAEEWVNAIKFYERPGQEPYLMAILASLGSPLLYYYDLDTKGVMMSLTGTGGAGKTTALKAASSIWGKASSSITGTSSTLNAKRALISQCRTLPAIYDDITQIENEELKELALEISQGQGRARGKVDGSVQVMERWQLVFLTSSNISLHQKLAEILGKGSADMNRVLELNIRPSVNVSAIQGQELLNGIQGNHGHVGEAFLKHVMTTDRQAGRELFMKKQLQLRAADKLQGSDRFVDTLICLCYSAHKMVKELYPQFPGNPEELFTWMREQLRDNNKSIKQYLSDRLPEIDDFISAFVVEDLIIEPTGKGYAKQGNSLKGYLYSAPEYYLAPRDVFNAWCRRNNLTARAVLEQWGATGRVFNHASPGHANRWSGRMRESIVIDGKSVNPNIVALRKSHADVKAETDKKSGNVTSINKASSAN